MEQGFSARVLTDSVSPAGIRLTTMEVRFPRFVLSEFNTHRTFCLDGDVQLYFDLPSGKRTKSGTKRFTMTLKEFYEKWNQGAEAPNNRTLKKTSAFALNAPYGRGGQGFSSWLGDEDRSEVRQPVRERLKTMHLRSCDERTGEIYHTTIRDVCYSGSKDVFRVVLEDGQSIMSSKDHLFLTDEGWQRLEDAIGLDLSPDGAVAWTKTPGFATDGAGLRKLLKMKRVEYVGVRDTFDIEVVGPYHNFVADGFIVHNSRNSASSRAVPTNRMIERVLESPAMPLEWGVNKPGMSASEALSDEQANEAKAEWLRARDSAVEHVRNLQKYNVHKQVINRLLEPFMWHTVIVTATEWKNFFDLRCAANAQPEIRRAAELMRDAMATSIPASVSIGDWHLPLVQDDERNLPIDQLTKISAARCARVSYLTHDGKRDITKDIELCERLLADRHLSPFEHVANPSEDTGFHANFRGWVQLRAAVEAGTVPR